MSKARTLANLISDNAELADGQISVAEVVGAAPTASPTFTGNIDAGDNVKIRLGDSDDLQIYHDGSHSYIQESGTGNLFVRASNLVLADVDGTQFLRGTANSDVKLYHNNDQKLATSATGVDVTGNLHVSSAGSTVLNVEATGANDSRVRITAGNANTSYVEFADPDDVDTGEIRYTHATNVMQFRTAGNVLGMTIDSSQNVGIGTDDPIGRLHSAAANNQVAVMAGGDVSDPLYPAFGFSGQIGSNGGRGAGMYLPADNTLAFSTAGSEAMRIDSSQNLLVGTTTNTFEDAGTVLRNDGLATITRDNSRPLAINRLTSDGDIVEFYKDGTTVGSIGIEASGFTIDGEAGHTGIQFGDQAVIPRENGANTNGVNDLGFTSGRWKDLYLSGGILLGGTGAANKLDDYEEGTWTPSFSNGTFTYGTRSGWYTKIGNVVHCGFAVLWNAKSGSGAVQVTLPFTFNSISFARASGSVGYISGIDFAGYSTLSLRASEGSVGANFSLSKDNHSSISSDVSNMSSTGEVQGSFTYTT